jgi:hypothetical protein
LLKAVFGLAFTRFFAFADALPSDFAMNPMAISSRDCDVVNCALLRRRGPGLNAAPALLHLPSAPNTNKGRSGIWRFV